jgi:hypothetical protein
MMSIEGVGHGSSYRQRERLEVLHVRFIVGVIRGLDASKLDFGGI